MLHRGSFTGFVAFVLIGCGGAAPAPEAPAGQPAQPVEPATSDSSAPTSSEEAPEDVASLQAQLAESERELLAVVAPSGGAVDGAEAVSGGSGAPRRRPAATTPPKNKPADEVKSGEVPRCDIACKALGSMRRSRDRICELTAPEDERCTGATTRVDDAAQRVTRAGCQCSVP